MVVIGIKTISRKNKYPLFLPPQHLAEKKVQDWSEEEAEEYFQWFMTNIDQRIENLCSFFGKSLQENPEKNLITFGKKSANILPESPFSEQKNNKRRLTDQGYALAADMGILLAQEVTGKYKKIHWKITKKPKSDFTFNLPTLYGFRNGLRFDPVRVSVHQAHSVLNGSKSYEAWLEIYKSWSNLIES